MNSVEIERKVDKKNVNYQWIFLCLFFSISFFHPITLLIFLFYLIFLVYKEKEIGGIKALNLLTLREVINPGLAIGYGVLQSIKWLLIFLISFYLICSVVKLHERDLNKLKKYFIFFIIYIIYSILSSFIFSNLPIVAIFKIISYAIPFIGLLIGVVYTRNKISWITWLKWLFSIIVIVSFPLIFLPLGYLRNSISFQGILNHPNLFGVFLVLFITLYLVSIQQRIKLRKNNVWNYLLVILGIIMILLTNSRTSLGSTLCILLIFILFCEYKLIKKVLFFSISSIIMAIMIPNFDILYQFLQDFFLKGGTNILDSRTDQLGSLMEAYISNPLFGRGFAVPYISERSYTFSFNYVVEPGNLIMAVLAYGGIFGLILFLFFIIKTILFNIKSFTTYIILPLSAILVCMGEMVFFSTNNIGIFIYMFLIIYVSEGVNIKSDVGHRIGKE